MPHLYVVVTSGKQRGGKEWVLIFVSRKLIHRIAILSAADLAFFRNSLISDQFIDIGLYIIIHQCNGHSSIGSCCRFAEYANVCLFFC